VDENNFRRFQAVMQAVSTIGAVIVFFVGLHRYHAEQAQLIRTRIEAEQWARDRDFGRELWLRQIGVLSKVADTVSRIAAMVADSESESFDAAAREYEQLYWGNVMFVDYPDLVQAMDDLRDQILYFRRGLEPIGGLSASDKVKQRAYSVAIACRGAIRNIGEQYVQHLSPNKAKVAISAK
jgi:hypothetical protein